MLDCRHRVNSSRLQWSPTAQSTAMPSVLERVGQLAISDATVSFRFGLVDDDRPQ